MKKTHLIIIMLAAAMFAGCTQTYLVTSRNDLYGEVDNVRSKLEQDGYRLTSARASSGNMQVAGVSMGIPSGRDSFTSQDTYRFVNDDGKTLTYSVAYQNRVIDTIPYVSAIQVCECETSDPDDFDRLCGKGSYVDGLNRIRQSTEIQVENKTQTALLATGIGTAIAALVAIPLIIASH